MTSTRMIRACVLVAEMAARAAHGDVKVADDVANGAGRFSRMDYGISERLERAWLVLHFTSRGPCRGADGECDVDDVVRVRVPGLTYDRAARQVLYREANEAPTVCAGAVRHRFLVSWETVDATGRCAVDARHVRAFDDDGFDGREEKRTELWFGARRATP